VPINLGFVGRDYWEIEMKIFMARYTAGGGNDFSALSMENLRLHLEDEHGGREVCSTTASNQTVDITWVDDIDDQHILQVVVGSLVRMDITPSYLSSVTEPFDIYVAKRANIDYWAGEVNNGYEEGSHEYKVYAEEIRLCAEQNKGKLNERR